MTAPLPGYAASVVFLDAACRQFMLWIDSELARLHEQVDLWEPGPCPEGNFIIYYEPVTVIVPPKSHWWQRPAVEIPASLHDPGLPNRMEQQ